MTREEAIQALKKEKRTALHENKVAFDMAIKALEQEPTTKNDLVVDCISRQAVIDEMEKRHTEGDCITKGFINSLPTVTSIRPKGHWIGNYQVDFGEWQEYDVKLSDGFVTDNCHCSECGEELLPGDRGMFCPYCGAL